MEDCVEAMSGSYALHYADTSNNTKPISRGHRQHIGVSDWVSSFIATRSAVGLVRFKLDTDTVEKIGIYHDRFVFGAGGANAVDSVMQRKGVGLFSLGKSGAFNTPYVQTTQATTQAQFEDSTHEVNTVGKFVGRMCWSITDNKMVVATRW
jgi:hypothetical protein